MAYLFQRPEAKEKLGDKAPWYVGWRDPAGRICKKKIGPKSQAKAFAAKIETDLARQTYSDTKSISWADFRKEYEKRELSTKRPSTRDTYRFAFDSFERISKPKAMSGVDTRMLDYFRSARLKEPGAKKGTTISEATVNCELRSLKAALRKAACDELRVSWLQLVLGIARAWKIDVLCRWISKKVRK